MNALLLLTALAIAEPAPHEHHDHSDQIGRMVFESTCNPQAHAVLLRGMAWLHSFEYAEARRVFGEAAAADPNCAIANWGVAMSYYHPLWDPPTPADLKEGAAAIEKARAGHARSEREQGFIAALGAFYRDSDRVDHKTRALAYSSAMEQLHDRYPADREAAVFYALSLIAAGTYDTDPNFTKERKAGAILNQVLAAEPDHPGVAHYLIHSFDYPPLADLALPAARRYATIAPDSAHAQHMPSHIFTRLGLWDEAIKSNRAAESAARSYAVKREMPGAWDQQLHAMDYLAYAYLQTGQDAEAQQVLEELNKIAAADPPTRTVAYAVAAIPARVLLERRRWSEAAQLSLPANLAGLTAMSNHKWAQGHILFANAVGAARSGDATPAREAVRKLMALEQSLTTKPGDYDWRKQISIERHIAEAWLALREGRRTESVSIMRAAADLDDATEKNPVTPGAVLPPREQLGDMLVELGRPAEALAAYEASLKRAPRRLAGLYGAAHAAQLAGDTAKAKSYYAELVDVTKASDGSRAEVKEARSELARLAPVAAVVGN